MPLFSSSWRLSLVFQNYCINWLWEFLGHKPTFKHPINSFCIKFKRFQHLACMLTVARYTGHRESAICQLRASDFLRTPEHAARVLAGLGRDEDHARHCQFGGLWWRAESAFRIRTPGDRRAPYRSCYWRPGATARRRILRRMSSATCGTSLSWRVRPRLAIAYASS